MSSVALWLRILHGLASLYFLACLGYLYYAAITRHYDALLIIAILSLAAEGLAVFALNKGQCPLIHIQRKVGDDKPFFELFFPPRVAKLAIPVFAVLTLVAILILIAPSLVPAAG